MMNTGAAMIARDDQALEDADSHRIPPADLDLEGVVLSALLLDYPAGKLDAVRTILRPAHFYSLANQRIYEAVCQLADRGTEPSGPAVAVELRASGRLAACGGAHYLALLAQCVPATAYVERDARGLVELWNQRELLRVLHECTAQVYNGQSSHKQARQALSDHFKAVGR